MVERQLVEYIKRSQEAGMPWDSIKQDLTSAGWSSGQIEEAREAVNIPKPAIPAPVFKSEVIPEKPIRTRQKFTSFYSALLAMVLLVSLLILAHNAIGDLLNKFAPLARNIGNSFLQSQEYRNYEASKRVAPQYPTLEVFNNNVEEYNQAVRDYLNNYNVWQNRDKELYNQYFAEYHERQQKKSSPVSSSFRLILHAVLVLPLWVISFLLYILVRQERKKYQALLFPFYLTSGWLLVYLFFSVAAYIYNANTVLGVYVVLAMLIAILTGAIWSIQKYRHSQQN